MSGGRGWVVSYPDPRHSSGWLHHHYLLPRSGDVIHPLLWRGSGYETRGWGGGGVVGAVRVQLRANNL